MDMSFQDSNCIWVHKKLYRPYLLIFGNRLPGLPLCMGAKNYHISLSHTTEMGFQDSHCAWGQKKKFSSTHYKRWASRTLTVSLSERFLVAYGDKTLEGGVHAKGKLIQKTSQEDAQKSY
jgi:hypothetical protein